MTGTNAHAQVCNVDIQAGTGGALSAQTIPQTPSSFVSDPELDIEIAADLSSVRLENSKIRVVYSGFFVTHSEYAIKDFVIKEANEDQAGASGDFMAAGAGRGPLLSATLTLDQEYRKTVRLEWARWAIDTQQVVPSDRIIIDVSIYPNQAFLQFDNIDIQWHTTVTDLASPGGTTNGVHVAYGAAGWNRGYITNDEIPYVGSYYDRHPPDGVNDPIDGGSLNYNGHFIVAVFNPANGRGFGRVLPVLDTSIIKLLLGPQTRRGIETAHYPFLNPHPPFTSYLFAIETGSDPLEIGRMLADSGGVQARIECGDTIQLSAAAYTDWLFSNWTDALSGDIANPTTIDVSGDLVIGANFDQASGDYTNDFDTALPGDDPIDWFDTAAGNSLVENDTLFEVFDVGNDRVFGTMSSETNIHSHYLGGAGTGGIGYELSGRLKVTDTSGGIGVTVFSEFPTGTGYYRLRRLADGAYHLAPVGTSLSGPTDTGVIPLANVWYRFRIQAEDTGTQTLIRAMVWKDGLAEPADWQVVAFDDSPSRRTGGSAGFWTLGTGGKYIDDVAIHVLQAPASNLVLTIQQVGSGTVSAAPDLVQYTQGDVVTLQATGSSGQVFGGWSGDLGGFENPTTITMLGNQNVTANFVTPTLQSLTLNVVGQGMLDANPAQTQYLLGDVVTLTANPAPGWGFSGWSGALQGSQNPETRTITGDLQVTATFVQFHLIENFDSTIPGGNAPDFLDTGAGNSLSQDDSLFSVELVDGQPALTTTSNQTNIHSHYTGTQLDGLGSYEFSGRMRLSDLNGGIGVTFFSQLPSALAYYRLRRFQGTSFHLSPVGTALTGDLDTGVMPLPNTWYEFRIQVDASGSATDVRAKVWATGSPEPAQWQADAIDSSAARLTSGTIGVWSLAAGTKHWDDFLVRPVPIVPPTLALDVSVIGNGSVTKTPDQPLYSTGDVVSLEAIADPGYLFVGWSGAAAGSNSPLDIFMNGNTSVSATFLKIEPHPLALSVAGNATGSVSASPDQPTYLTGEVVTLTATPAPGLIFDHWEGDIMSMLNPLQLTILGPTSVIASFRIPDYLNRFDSLVIGTSPTDWFDTGANNSLLETPGLFDVRDVSGQNAFGTDSTAINTHSHWLGSGSDSLADYRYSGRFRISDLSAGIGVTALSQFPNQAAYYRLRRYQNTTFHLSPFGTSFTSGTTDTGISPFANVWYRFLMEVEDMGSETRVRAKVWQDGNPEPAFFQVEAIDASPSRLSAGTFGVWALGPGSKNVDDLAISVPEPDAPAMLMAGMGMLALLARSRRNAARQS